jgi:threonine synthase
LRQDDVDNQRRHFIWAKLESKPDSSQYRMLNSFIHRNCQKQLILHNRRTATVLQSRWSTTKKGKDDKDVAEETVLTTAAIQDQRERDRLIRDSLPVTFADISRAHVAIRDGIVRTKCEKSVFLSEIIGANIYLKPEFRQFTGSFKERGARNAILKLKHRDMEAAKRGVIAASAGNHALALAYHGRELGIPVTVVMPTVAPLAKVDKCRKFGARIIIEGMHIGESKTYAETLVNSEGLTYINGYDDPPIVAGAGTIGIELIDDVPNVDVVVVPVGGAGLIAGISCSVKTLKPEVQVSLWNWISYLVLTIDQV